MEQTYHAPRTSDGRRADLDRTDVSALKWEDYLVGLLMTHVGLYPHVCAIISENDFAGTETRALYQLCVSVYLNEASPTYSSFEERVPSELIPALNRVLEAISKMSPRTDDDLVKEAVQCATRLKKTRLLNLNTELKFLLIDAAKNDDKESFRKYQAQTVAIQRQLLTLNTATRLENERPNNRRRP